MKKFISISLFLILILGSLFFNVSATNDYFVPHLVDFVLTTEVDSSTINVDESRASGLIHAYSLSLSESGTTLYIGGQTLCSSEVVKCGFKNLTIERRKTSSDSWKDYYEFGNVYAEAIAANLSTTLVVESGYQYRISCKHYAKKNLFSTQTVSNTSNIVTVS